MIDSGQKTSLLIPSQLPEFVRDDPNYANFVLFLQAYYEWMEQNENLTDRTKNILNYKDVDKTSEQFLEYFKSDFLSYFPKEILADERKVIKIAKELYQSKGTPSSYKFLFKVLYGTDVDFFYTKDVVLKASAGKWYIAKSLRLATEDLNFLNIANLRVFGETTKSLATVETSVVSGTKIEVFISNVERLFQSGETIRVVDSNNQDVLFDGQTLRAKVVGQISQIKIDPNNRGLLYQPGDPVVVYGGLNSVNGIGATATVGATTTGSIRRVSVSSGGFGYRNDPYTILTTTNAPGAILAVGDTNPDPALTANATYIPIDYIGKKKNITIGASNYVFSNIAIANANTTLINAFTFTAFTTYPISSVLVKNGGGGISGIPVITANTTYYSEDYATTADLASLGILAPIQINSGGLGYRVNDKINISGGTGYGAFANVTSVASNGQILSVSYVYPTNDSPHHYPLGGMGYRLNGLPLSTVVSSNVSASGASLYVPGILGAGASFDVSVDRVGSVTSINIENYGEDYIATPNVSLKVQDITVSNVSIYDIPQSGDIIYQGSNLANSKYIATVSGVNLVTSYNDPTQSIWTVRVYNYNSAPNTTDKLKIVDKNISMNVYSSKIFGDGAAKATAIFLNGLTISQGQYLDTSGQPSAHDVLQNEVYNNYTYEITLEKEIAKYRNVLLDLLHPTGMKVLGRYALKSNSVFSLNMVNITEQGHTLGYYTGNPGSYGVMTSTWTNQSNNVINFYGLSGANLQNIIVVGDSVTLTTANGFNVHSEVVEVNVTPANTVTLKDNVWTTFANVAYVHANSGTNIINITSLTNSYDIINNGKYSNTAYPLKDIVYAGDYVLVANNIEKQVQAVNYTSGIVYLNSNLTSPVNSLMSVRRTISTSTVRIDGFVGTVYYPSLTDELGNLLATENDNVILLG